VERALRLVATGTLTIDMVNAAKGKTVNLPKTMNLATAKESMRQTGFSDVAWGKATRNYAKSACSLSDAKFDIIIKEAKEFISRFVAARLLRPQKSLTLMRTTSGPALSIIQTMGQTSVSYLSPLIVPH